jgi:hypothetical protein
LSARVSGLKRSHPRQHSAIASRLTPITSQGRRVVKAPTRAMPDTMSATSAASRL